MSVYKVVDTEITDIDMLKEAIQDLGIKTTDIKEHEVAQNLRGWNSRTKAKWILRKELAKSSYDIGFNIKDGKIEALVESMDNSDIASSIRQGTLKQCYAKRMILKVLAKEFKNAKIKQQRLKDGRLKIMLEMD